MEEVTGKKRWGDGEEGEDDGERGWERPPRRAALRGG